MLAAAARSPHLVGAGPASRHIVDSKCFRSTGVPQCTTDKLSTHTHTQTPVITRQNDDNKPAKNLIEISCYSSGSDSPHRHRCTHRGTFVLMPNRISFSGQWAGLEVHYVLPHTATCCASELDPSKCMLPWASMSLSPNVISIGSPVSAQLTSVPNTHRHADHATCDV